MKITDFQNEDALELVADLITPATEIFTDAKLRDMVRKGGNKINVIKHILKNHQKPIIEIFARMHNTPVKEYKCNVVSLTKDLLDIMNDDELLAVFTSAEQKMENTSFGSATENIEE